jgi:hypothetical protein
LAARKTDRRAAFKPRAGKKSANAKPQRMIQKAGQLSEKIMLQARIEL